jgi:PIN domain nuclease of toxin-antitoxin system
VRLLLDTHTFLYWVSGNRRLPPRARSAIARPRAEVQLSAASVWEIRIKVAKGRLRISFDDVSEEAGKHSFGLLPITAAHAQFAGDLPPHHEDPFDRMLVAQSRMENLTIVTGDGALAPYAVPILWD